MRLDVYLTENGFFSSRSKAVFAIKEGNVMLDGAVVRKPAEPVDGRSVKIIGRVLGYVGRGGLKLEGALNCFLVDVTGWTCLDLGASTGGFTDCLLQHGARKVYALDVGCGQLDEKLRADSRVTAIENFNARELKEDTLPCKMDLVVSDLSFISQKLVYLPVASVLKEKGLFISLVKPQFEAGRQALNKKGVVKDRKEHIRVISTLIDEAERYGLHIEGIAPSPITGADGNREYLVLFRYNSYEEKRAIDEDAIKKAVYAANNDRSKEN